MSRSVPKFLVPESHICTRQSTKLVRRASGRTGREGGGPGGSGARVRARACVRRSAVGARTQVDATRVGVPARACLAGARTRVWECRWGGSRERRWWWCLFLFGVRVGAGVCGGGARVRVCVGA